MRIFGLIMALHFISWKCLIYNNYMTDRQTNRRTLGVIGKLQFHLPLSGSITSARMRYYLILRVTFDKAYKKPRENHLNLQKNRPNICKFPAHKHCWPPRLLRLNLIVWQDLMTRNQTRWIFRVVNL